MTALKGALRQMLRGKTVSGLLERLGIEPRRYWILVDLFHTLSERRDTVQQLGGMALLSWPYPGGRIQPEVFCSPLRRLISC